ncbi:MAG: TrmB family transcriptional regulator [Candidatus Bathyarchaeia archaeon]
MKQDELVRSLVQFGLTNTEASVYLAAVNLQEATGRQISITSGKERAQTHHALRGLQQLGLVEVTLSVPARFRPVELKYALDQLYSYQSVKLRNLDERRKTIASTVFASDIKIPFIGESYSIVKGRINVYLRTVEAIKMSNREISIMLSAQGLMRFRRFTNILSSMRSRARKGVKLRIITQINSQNLSDVKAFSKFCELRHMNNQLTNASVYDEKIGSIALSLDETLDLDVAEHVSFWTTAKGFVGTLAHHIDSAWFVAAPLDFVKIEQDHA